MLVFLGCSIVLVGVAVSRVVVMVQRRKRRCQVSPVLDMTGKLLPQSLGGKKSWRVFMVDMWWKFVGILVFFF